LPGAPPTAARESARKWPNLTHNPTGASLSWLTSAAPALVMLISRCAYPSDAFATPYRLQSC
jgi:hypothetical protein